MMEITTYPVTYCFLVLLSCRLASSTEIRLQPLTNPTYWGPWSEWSACSSKCGQGVETRTRDCRQWNLGNVKLKSPWECEGYGKRKRLCFKKCIEDPESAKSDECSGLNSIFAKDWTEIKYGYPCKVVCRSTDNHQIRTIRIKKNGTPCKTYHITNGKCIGGLCKRIDRGCQDSKGKPLELDMCQVCGGDNSTCHRIEGTFTTSINDDLNGMSTVVQIPQGSTSIKIVKYGNAKNTLALVESPSRFVINDRGWPSREGNYKINGVTWIYCRNITEESFTTEGPIARTVTVMLTFRFPKQVVHYSFWIPKGKGLEPYLDKNVSKSPQVERETTTRTVNRENTSLGEDEKIWDFLDTQLQGQRTTLNPSITTTSATPVVDAQPILYKYTEANSDVLVPYTGDTDTDISIGGEKKDTLESTQEENRIRPKKDYITMKRKQVLLDPPYPDFPVLEEEEIWKFLEAQLRNRRRKSDPTFTTTSSSLPRKREPIICIVSEDRPGVLVPYEKESETDILIGRGSKETPDFTGGVNRITPDHDRIDVNENKAVLAPYRKYPPLEEEEIWEYLETQLRNRWMKTILSTGRPLGTLTANGKPDLYKVLEDDPGALASFKTKRDEDFSIGWDPSVDQDSSGLEEYWTHTKGEQVLLKPNRGNDVLNEEQIWKFLEVQLHNRKSQNGLAVTLTTNAPPVNKESIRDQLLKNDPDSLTLFEKDENQNIQIGRETTKFLHSTVEDSIMAAKEDDVILEGEEGPYPEFPVLEEEEIWEYLETQLRNRWRKNHSKLPKTTSPSATNGEPILCIASEYYPGVFVPYGADEEDGVFIEGETGETLWPSVDNRVRPEQDDILISGNQGLDGVPSMFGGERFPKGMNKRQKKDKAKKRRKKKYRKRPNDVYISIRPNEYCYPCLRAKDKARQFCTSDFVSKIHINRRKVVGNETRFDVTILSSYRNRVRLMQREYIWLESTCRCPRLKSKRTYIVMGTMQNLSDRMTRLVITPKSYIRGFSLGFDRKIRQLTKTIRCPGK